MKLGEVFRTSESENLEKKYLSENKIKIIEIKKILKILGGVLLGGLLLLGGICLSWYWLNMGEDEVYILPNDFTGAVIVLYGQKDGDPKKYDDKGNRIYHIPENGTLKTQFDFQEDWRQVKYIYKNGKTLRYLLPPDDVWNDTIANTKRKNDSVYVFGSTTRGDFLVGKVTQIDSLWKVLDKKWEQYNYGRAASDSVTATILQK